MHSDAAAGDAVSGDAVSGDAVSGEGLSRADALWMQRACALALQGEGAVEPNPMVGCVLVRDGKLLAEGFHASYGGPHAERVALAGLDGQSARGATAYVTLEPCCHHGKTPPCTDALIEAGIARVCCAVVDPFPAVSGAGIQKLRQAGIIVDVDCERQQAEDVMAPYLKRLKSGLPFVIAKWAMSLDGKMATHIGDSRWISSDTSRQHAHRMRGRVDAIVVGSRTALLDDPLLTARPKGPRLPVRVVVDSLAALPSTSQLVQTSRVAPVLIWCGPQAKPENVSQLRALGCRVEICPDSEHRLQKLMEFLAREFNATNVLFEGGGQLLGHLFDSNLVDEVQVYIAPKLIGGAAATIPLATVGIAHVAAGPGLVVCERTILGEDFYLRARLAKPSTP